MESDVWFLSGLSAVFGAVAIARFAWRDRLLRWIKRNHGDMLPNGEFRPPGRRKAIFELVFNIVWPLAGCVYFAVGAFLSS